MTSERDESDAALVEAALAGEQKAFSALMTRYKAPLYRFVRAYVGDADEALDLVQEAFVTSWTALKSFDRSRSFPTWLRRVALNKCRDWSRRRSVRRFFFGAISLDADAVAVAEPRSEDSARDEDLARLDAALAALPRALREPLLLTLFEGLSHKEAASLLRISPKAIETRIYRARKALQRALKRDGDEEQPA